MRKLIRCNMLQQAGYTENKMDVYNNLTYRSNLFKKMLKLP